MTYDGITRDLGRKAAADCNAAVKRTGALCADPNQQFHVTLHAAVGLLGVAMVQFRAISAADGGEPFQPRRVAETLCDKVLRPMMVATAIGEPSEKAATAILAGLAEDGADASDTWIKIETLGTPTPGVWPWNGEAVLIHCASLHEGYPGPTGEARYLDEDKGQPCWDWWWAGYGPDNYHASPLSDSNGPVTHVRRIVPPVGG